MALGTHCCITITTVHLQNVFIFPNWNFSLSSDVFYPTFYYMHFLMLQLAPFFFFFITFISGGCEIFYLDNVCESAYCWTFMWFPLFLFGNDKHLCVYSIFHILAYFLRVVSRSKNMIILVIFKYMLTNFF